ncbi:MAG: hypothetical protein RQ936_09740 [Gammaproteobacteria bacterium]|nr:hypothetical protein [Gammaproteobacteria bacterium]
MKPYFYLIFAACLYSAGSKAETGFSVAPSLLNFDYTEFKASGGILDQETGLIPGIQLLLTRDFSAQQLSAELEISTYDGNVDYAGHTQSGLAHDTTTNEELFEIGARLVAPLFTNTDVYLGAKYQRWNRDIFSNNGVAGLFERYQWWELSAGTRISFPARKNQNWIADIALLRTINPTIYVDLASIDGGDADLDLGPDTGARLQLMWVLSNDHQTTYAINAFYEMWGFGRSDSKATSGGSTNYSIYEPESETRHSGVQFQLGFQY